MLPSPRRGELSLLRSSCRLAPQMLGPLNPIRHTQCVVLILARITLDPGSGASVLLSPSQATVLLLTNPQLLAADVVEELQRQHQLHQRVLQAADQEGAAAGEQQQNAAEEW